MVCKVNCAAIMGVDVLPVIVETDICNGLPSFDMVGLLSYDIKESRERVRTAIKNSGFLVPPKRITINFSPGNIRKAGTYFDLPVAVSILWCLDIIKCRLDDKMFVGELSLSGRGSSCKWSFTYSFACYGKGNEILFCAGYECWRMPMYKGHKGNWSRRFK